MYWNPLRYVRSILRSETIGQPGHQMSRGTSRGLSGTNDRVPVSKLDFLVVCIDFFLSKTP